MQARFKNRDAHVGVALPRRAQGAISWGFVAGMSLGIACAGAGTAGDMSAKKESAPPEVKIVEKPASNAAAKRARLAVTAGPLSASGAGAKVALAGDTTRTRTALKPGVVAAGTPSTTPAEEAAIPRARRMIAECQTRYQAVSDYTCTFYKRERVDGQLTELNVMRMKVRTNPHSVYFKFQQPSRGREAIYIAGRNGGKILAHDVGFNKLLAGTLQLEPTSARAMENCRHPITEAGIGALLDTVARRWALELSPDESVMTFRGDVTVGANRCTMIESTHPARRPHFLYYRVRLFIDQELGLPIRFEAYNWPTEKDGPGDLAEEYSYMNLRLNVGLRDIDFDAANPNYSFGRF
jgi:hypothetical protein